MQTLIGFIILQFLNVVSATCKFYVTVKGGKIIAGLVNAANYTISALVTLVLITQETKWVILVSFFTNLIGVPLGKGLIHLFTKEKLWVYNATIRGTREEIARFRSDLKSGNGIHSTFEEIYPEQLYSMKIFAYHRADSRIIKQKIKGKDAKYYIVEAI